MIICAGMDKTIKTHKSHKYLTAYYRCTKYSWHVPSTLFTYLWPNKLRNMMRLHCLNTTLQMIWRLGVGVSCRAWYAWLFSFHLSSSRLPQFLKSNVLSVVSIEAVHCCLQIPQFKTSRDLACHLDSHISTSKHNPDSPCNHCQAASASTCRRAAPPRFVSGRKFHTHHWHIFLRINLVLLGRGSHPESISCGTSPNWGHAEPLSISCVSLTARTRHETCWPAKTSKQHASNYYYPIVWGHGHIVHWPLSCSISVSCTQS